MTPEAGTRLEHSRDGDRKELFYSTADGKMMPVEVKAGSSFEAGAPKALFDLALVRTNRGVSFAVTADGQRFLFVCEAEESARLQYTVVVNLSADLARWETAALRRQVQRRR